MVSDVYDIVRDKTFFCFFTLLFRERGCNYWYETAIKCKKMLRIVGGTGSCLIGS